MIIFVNYHDIDGTSIWEKFEVNRIISYVTSINTKIMFIRGFIYGSTIPVCRFCASVPCNGTYTDYNVPRLFFNNKLYCLSNITEFNECSAVIQMQLNNEEMEQLLATV